MISTDLREKEITVNQNKLLHHNPKVSFASAFDLKDEEKGKAADIELKNIKYRI